MTFGLFFQLAGQSKGGCDYKRAGNYKMGSVTMETKFSRVFHGQWSCGNG